MSRHYPDWKAPSADEEFLIWPQPSQLLAHTFENLKQLSAADSVRVQGVSLPQLRKHMRGFIGHEDDRPLVVTGHQAELHHPGVWVKNAVIDAMGRRLGGEAMHLAVDTDAPKHLVLRWPGGTIPISDDPRLTTAAWSGLLASPSPVHLEQIRRSVNEAAAGWSFTPAIGGLIDSLRRLALESGDLASSLTNAMHELDWDLGLKYHALLASPLWVSDGFLLLVHDLLGRADDTAGRYNAALADYRQEQGIRSTTRPMPDLVTSLSSVEAPFWLDDLDAGMRTRPSVFRTDGGWVLQLLDGEEFVFDRHADGWEAAGRLQRWLVQSRYRLTPRALTLMLFVRLALADQFVHGIGGARYDQVTDRFIQTHYGMPAPHFGVATATFIFPDAVKRQRACVPCVKQEGHRVKHSLLGPRKRELVAQIAAMPRGSAERSNVFFQMHSELAARAEETGVLSQWQQRLQETIAREQEEQTLFDRELFYAIQPRERLEGMIRRVDSTILK